MCVLHTVYDLSYGALLKSKEVKYSKRSAHSAVPSLKVKMLSAFNPAWETPLEKSRRRLGGLLRSVCRPEARGCRATAESWRALGGDLGPQKPLLESPLTRLGGSLSCLGGSWRALGVSWAVLQASWEVLGLSHGSWRQGASSTSIFN